MHSTLRTLVLSAAMATCALFAAPTAKAEPLCRCAYPSLATAACDSALTADVFVWAGQSDPSTRNNVYFATVLRVYEGATSSRLIRIEAPATCGFEFDLWRRYTVALGKGSNGAFTSFACSSFVKQTRDLDRAERRFLADDARCAPSCDDIECEEDEVCVLQDVQCVTEPCYPVPVCEPAEDSCYDYTGRDFGLCEAVLGWAAQDGVCTLVSGCPDDEVPFYRSRAECLAGCGVEEGGLCYRFEEQDPNSFVNLPCADGLKCTATDALIGFNSYRYCMPLDFCIDDSTAATDCEGIPHIAEPGEWGCDDNVCTWRW